MKNIIYDLEVFPNFFLFGCKDYNTKEFTLFEISDRKNQYKEIVNFLLKGDIDYMIGYNNLNYDYPILHTLLSKDLSRLIGANICSILKSKSDSIIRNQNEKNFRIPPWDIKLKQLDLKSIWHFDNKAKLVSLKWIQFMIDWYNLEDLPYHPNTILNDEQKNKVIEYWYNDINSTEEFLNITKGKTELPEYKGKDKLKLRKTILDNYKIDCLNYNDVKIGEMLVKKDYCVAENISSRELKPIEYPIDFKFGDCFPDYITFETDHFKKFIDYLKVQPILYSGQKEDKQKFTFKVNQTEYTIAKGGIHSNDLPRIIKPNQNEILQDSDVGSQYPNAIRKRQLKPRHLTQSWLINYTNYISERINAKHQFKKTNNPDFKSFDELFKLALNGGTFGKLGEKTNWQNDPFILLCITIGNQIEILKLIEMFELAGIKVISANTDGVVTLYDKDKEEIFNDICTKWEKIVGNQDLGKLEHKRYKMLAQTSVNDYIALDEDGKVKKKGDFLTDYELHKNKSKKIIPIALEQYFINGIKPEITIKNHKNIFDFCIAIKGNSDSEFYLIDQLNNNETKLQKINRFYVSNSTDIMIKKLPKLESKVATFQVDIFGDVDDGSRYSVVESGYNVTIFNKFAQKDDYNINYNYYISECYKIINQIINNESKKESIY